jgi:hypothetical protein
MQAVAIYTIALLLEELYDIPPGIARLVAWNICLDIPKVL